MDVTETEIINQLNRHQCKVCIHGHTHKPCLHKELNYKRLVLGDWDQDIWVAILEDNKLQQYKADIKSMNNEDDWALSNLCKMHSLII